jgi:hypothetical protein
LAALRLLGFLPGVQDSRYPLRIEVFPDLLMKGKSASLSDLEIAGMRII